MLTLSRKAGESVFIGNKIKVTLLGKDGDQVFLSLEVQSDQSPPIEAKPPLSLSLKVLFEKVNTFVSMVRFRKLRAVGPSAIQIACQKAVREYPGGIRALTERFSLSQSFEDRLFYGEPSQITVHEFTTILKATRSQYVVDALADLLQ